MTSENESNTARRRFVITGAVQGVGFRPFVYRLAHEHGLAGSVRNAPEGVVVEAQGQKQDVDAFARDIENELPPLARIVDFSREDIPAVAGEEGFVIHKSDAGEGHRVLISPDVATCPDCLAEIFDPDDRRHLYPFTNCTNCGPRYTITSDIPYDRPGTSMACFAMCENCAREYEDPLDRRFHAQPNACPVCGPRVWLTDQKGEEQAERREAVRLTAERLAGGEIAAIKGLGGFHLACDAACDEAVERLRRRKNRPDKPLAVMAPDMETAMLMAQIGRQESWWLSGIHRPIVLARKRKDSPLSKLVAPDTGHVGLMLPYTPLHHVLLAAYRRIIPDDRPSALVMTSGNMSSEPIALGNREALHRLAHIADFFLLHDRDILIRCDDSVLRVVPGQIGEFMPEGYEFPPGTQLLRRARGFTPVPVFLSREGESVLGTGPELKNTMALTKGGQAFVSQHIGDMENLETLAFWNEIRKHLKGILETEPKEVVRDLHPDYMTTRWAEEQAEKPVHPLQHHYAHVHAVLAEHRIEEAVLGLALDGTGYGDDGSLWGGELLYVDPAGPEHGRLAHFSPVRLPGGEAAIRGPWRIAQAVLHDMGMREPRGREWPWLKSHARASEVTAQLLDKDLNCPRSTSCGRLFDAVSAMIGLCLSISYEAQAAIVLEQVQDMNERGAYPVRLDLSREPAVLDTFELFGRVLDDFEAGVSAGRISRRFHLGLVQGLADLTSHFRDRTGISAVALSGGVMQNLTVASLLPVELAKRRLDPLLHGYLPPGDACISLGQAHYGLSLRKDTPQK